MRHVLQNAVLLFAITSVFVATAQTPSAAPKAAENGAPAGDVQNGKKIFGTYGCYQCHDYDGKGGAGARIAPNPIPFAAFTRYVRNPRGEMPPYTVKVVTDKELGDIYAFLKTIPKPPAPASLSILNN